MVNIISKKARCPLCHRGFKTYKMKQLPGQPVIAVCRPCEVVIPVLDSHFLKWESIEGVTCPHCEDGETRVFTRSDGYTKLFCPKCKFMMETASERKIGEK